MLIPKYYWMCMVYNNILYIDCSFVIGMDFGYHLAESIENDNN